MLATHHALQLLAQCASYAIKSAIRPSRASFALALPGVVVFYLYRLLVAALVLWVVHPSSASTDIWPLRWLWAASSS